MRPSPRGSLLAEYWRGQARRPTSDVVADALRSLATFTGASEAEIAASAGIVTAYLRNSCHLSPHVPAAAKTRSEQGGSSA
jgi:hypothetical protein